MSVNVQTEFLKRVIWYLHNIQSDTNRWFPTEVPIFLPESVGQLQQDPFTNEISIVSWNTANLGYGPPSTSDLEAPTDQQVTDFYESAYAIPQRVLGGLDNSNEVTSADLLTMETSQLRQETYVFNTTDSKHYHLHGSTWVPSHYLSGVISTDGDNVTYTTPSFAPRLTADEGGAVESSKETKEEPERSVFQIRTFAASPFARQVVRRQEAFSTPVNQTKPGCFAPLSFSTDSESAKGFSVDAQSGVVTYKSPKVHTFNVSAHLTVQNATNLARTVLDVAFYIRDSHGNHKHGNLNTVVNLQLPKNRSVDDAYAIPVSFTDEVVLQKGDSICIGFSLQSITQILNVSHIQLDICPQA